jgi:hypothetical protein
VISGDWALAAEALLGIEELTPNGSLCLPVFPAAMTDEPNQGRDRDAGKRIASLIQSIGQSPQKQVSREELQKLKTAAARLDKMLKEAADSDRQELQDAAGRLDRLLVDIRKGKDVPGKLKRQRDHREPRQT